MLAPEILISIQQSDGDFEVRNPPMTIGCEKPN